MIDGSWSKIFKVAHSDRPGSRFSAASTVRLHRLVCRNKVQDCSSARRQENSTGSEIQQNTVSAVARSHRLRWICYYMRACASLMPQTSLTKITHTSKNNKKRAASGTNNPRSLIRTGKNAWSQFEEQIISRQGRRSRVNLVFPLGFYQLTNASGVFFCHTFCWVFLCTLEVETITCSNWKAVETMSSTLPQN